MALKSPNQFSQAVLDAQDFDGTMFATFEQASGLGIYGVDEAYKIAVEKSFFFDRDALKRYEDEGGHQNRTPSEIAHSLAPNSTDEGLELITNALVTAKLAVLQGQIGKKLADGAMWPRPIPGYLEYAQTVKEMRGEGAEITTAVLSAGHSSFIRKVLELYGIDKPDIMITDETIRGLNSPQNPERYSKPAVMPLNLARLQWLDAYGITEAVPSREINSRIVVIGDSEEKDGGLARNAGVDFIHVTPDDNGEAWGQMRARHLVGQQALREAA